jgi:hypothetical protein
MKIIKLIKSWLYLKEQSIVIVENLDKNINWIFKFLLFHLKIKIF